MPYWFDFFIVLLLQFHIHYHQKVECNQLNLLKSRREMKYITLIDSLTLWHSRARILRLPCKVEASFDVVIEGRILVNNVIKSYTVESVQECFDKCSDEHSNCKSINHKRLGSDNCQLNNKIHEETTPSNLIINDQWTYYSTNYSTRYVSNYKLQILLMGSSPVYHNYFRLNSIITAIAYCSKAYWDYQYWSFSWG